MPKNADRTLLRLSIRVGEIAVRDSRLVRIEECLDGARVKVRDLATGESSEVSLSSLRGHSAIADGASIDAHLENARASTGVAWRRATTREQALGAPFEGSGPWGQRANDVAKTIGITRRTLYGWLARYRDAAATSSLVPLTRSVRRGARRLDGWVHPQLKTTVSDGTLFPTVHGDHLSANAVQHLLRKRDDCANPLRIVEAKAGVRPCTSTHRSDGASSGRRAQLDYCTVAWAGVRGNHPDLLTCPYGIEGGRLVKIAPMHRRALDRFRPKDRLLDFLNAL